jgi:hypothetical protein
VDADVKGAYCVSLAWRPAKGSWLGQWHNRGGIHGLRRNAGFDGWLNGSKFFGFQNGRHGGENSRPRTAMKSQFSTPRRKAAEKNPKGIQSFSPALTRQRLRWVVVPQNNSFSALERRWPQAG